MAGAQHTAAYAQRLPQAADWDLSSPQLLTCSRSRLHAFFFFFSITFLAFALAGPQSVIPSILKPSYRSVPSTAETPIR